MTNEEEILKELKKISKVVTIGNGPAIEKELLKYATSDDRKKIWALMDGKRQSDEIAKIVGKTKRAIDIFLKILEDATLVEREFNKPPVRALDYVPANWIELLQKESPISEEQQITTQQPEQPSQEGVTNV